MINVTRFADSYKLHTYECNWSVFLDINNYLISYIFLLTLYVATLFLEIYLKDFADIYGTL